MTKPKEKVLNQAVRFLETLTAWGDDALVPIDKIKFAYITNKGNGWEIRIESHDGDWAECFGGDDEKLEKRWNQIKDILNAK